MFQKHCKYHQIRIVTLVRLNTLRLHHLLKDHQQLSKTINRPLIYISDGPISEIASPFTHHPSTITLHPLPFTLHHLKEHANDGHHRQSSVCQLCIELCFLDLRISRCDELPSKVTSCSRSSSRLVLGNFAEGHVGQNLTPTCGWHFRDCGKTIGHICKLQASRRRQVGKSVYLYICSIGVLLGCPNPTHVCGGVVFYLKRKSQI